MPFTIAHAAAAPPLWRLSRRRLVLSAVAVGAMAPDFEYLVHLAPHRTISHTLLGVLVLCLPASLAVLLAWHRLLRPALGHVLPDRFGTLIAAPFPFLPAGRLLAIVASVIAGSFSHLAWDAFTHEHGAVVTRVGLLAGSTWAGGPPVYRALQYGSSVVGMLLIGVWFHRLASRGCPGTGPSAAAGHLRRSAIGIVTVAGVVAATANAFRHATAGGGPRQVLAAAVIAAMSAGLLAALATSAAVLRQVNGVAAPE